MCEQIASQQSYVARMKSFFFGAAAVCLLLSACSSGSTSSDVEDSLAGTSEGSIDTVDVATSEADQTTESDAPEDTASAEGSSGEATVAEAQYRDLLVEQFPTSVSDETLDCMVETALELS